MDKRYFYPAALTAFLTGVLLTIVQVVPTKPLLLMERLIPAGCWIQVPYCFRDLPGAASFVTSGRLMPGARKGKGFPLLSVTTAGLGCVFLA